MNSYNNDVEGNESYTTGFSYVKAFENELKKLYSASLSLRYSACVEIGNLAFLGGEIIENQVLQTIYIICRSNQLYKILIEYKLFDSLLTLLNDRNEDIVNIKKKL
ncbi:hypothetical protein BCR36DRAFT_369722 [Piromyces finnis]|uniref:Uncharacterized protein n=1 Tax=Piromyces finnis TaxID=1754191 RepID=A0A1Y1VB81_9FUNG|nr:hypothetical protein BCR36DRAFT_369722 [Piromyces finnis]|eukprot:ORX51812.1 hypothetical protein BCR36DRAFT_369722 [Piromyces finnis]